MDVSTALFIGFGWVGIAIQIALIARVWPDFARALCEINNRCVDDAEPHWTDRFCADRCITESPR